MVAVWCTNRIYILPKTEIKMQNWWHFRTKESTVTTFTIKNSFRKFKKIIAFTSTKAILAKRGKTWRYHSFGIENGFISRSLNNVSSEIIIRMYCTPITLIFFATTQACYWGNVTIHTLLGSKISMELAELLKWVSSDRLMMIPHRWFSNQLMSIHKIAVYHIT